MKDSLKWIVTAIAVIVFIGALIGARQLDAPRVASTSPERHIVAPDTPDHGYPAPEITIDAQVARSRQDRESLSRSSSLYVDYSYSHRKHHSHKHKEKSSDAVGEVDKEMGMMSADDKKLRDAMEKADRMEKTDREFHVDPNNH